LEVGKMTKKSSVEDDVARLGKEAAAVREARVSRGEREDKPVKAVSATEEEADTASLGPKLEEFVGALQKDLRDIPAIAAVGFFALGVLMGRLLRK
jgi:hypothetical protein